MAFDLVLRGGTIVTPGGCAERDIAVSAGVIAAVGHFAGEQGERTLSCRGLHILPGVIDSHVHFREPGLSHKEDLESGSRAAVKGGVTAVFEMPNTSPPTTSEEALAEKLARAAGRMHCDFAFYVGATHANIGTLSQLETLPGCCGVKVFMGSSTGELLVDDDDSLSAILARISRRAAFHSEDEARLRERRHLQVENDPSSHPLWRDAEAARRATARLLRLAREARKPVHVLHVSTADELPLLAAASDIASFEITPHHLTLASPHAYRELGTRAQMNPPIRDDRHHRALWEAVGSGLVQLLGSDHAPHTLDEKAKPYPRSPSGMPGVQTLVPVMLDHVNRRRLAIERFVELTSYGPARIFGIRRKGRIAEGNDADFTIVDLKAIRRIEDRWIESRCGWTPYAGMECRGWPVGTIVRGNIVMWEENMLSPPIGAAVQFASATTSLIASEERL